jgi:hypothetical protein
MKEDNTKIEFVDNSKDAKFPLFNVPPQLSKGNSWENIFKGDRGGKGGGARGSGN